MKKTFIIYILFIVALGAGIPAKSQEQKKPSERSFTNEISKIKQIQKERTRLIEQTKSQTAETATSKGTGSVPVKTENQTSSKIEIPQTTKPSSGEMRKPKKPVASKVD